MSLSTAMLVGFTGITSNQTTVQTVGDNIANANTTSFKRQRTLFETQLYRTVTEGEAPTAETGGTLPHQLGMGSRVAALQRDFSQGSLQSTGFGTDLAIDGRGFFIVDQADGTRAYTRSGAFTLDATNTLVAQDGAAVMGFAADINGAIDTSTLTTLNVPMGAETPAVPTGNVVMDGQLNADADIAASGAVAVSDALVTSDGEPASSATALTDLVSDLGTPLFAEGDSVTVAATKGGLALPESTFVVGTDGDTLGDFAAYLESVFGIDTDPTTGGGAGVTIGDGTDAPAGSIVVRSNPGTVNAIEVGPGAIVNTGSLAGSPMSFATTTPATGDAVTTSFQVVDSLGATVDVRLRLSLESRSDAGTTWRYYAESADDSDLSPLLGTGTVSFDSSGQFVSATGSQISVDRAGTGAASPLTFNLGFEGVTSVVTSDGSSQLVMASQDGLLPGMLTGFEIDSDGVITGTFSNQVQRVLGQVALATFINEEGLIATSQNRYVEGPNSGTAAVVQPNASGAGSIVAGSLEESNVEIAREFVDLLAASTGISSASRVVRTADELLQELLLIAR